MRFILSIFWAAALVFGGMLFLSGYFNSIELDRDGHEPRERVVPDTPTRMIEGERVEDEREEREMPPRPIVDEREEYDIESLYLDCPIGWHPPENLPKGARFDGAHPRVRKYPDSPDGAQEDGRLHTVHFMYDIERGGYTSNVRIYGASPSDLWNRSVVAAVRGWTFWPATLDGETVKLNHCIAFLNLE